MMHILGYLHEHMRFDRDKFINIHHENIKLGMNSLHASKRCSDN